jgi:hypothetical protein
MMTMTDDNYNEWQLQLQWHRTIHICELYSDGVQKSRKIFIFFTSFFF